MKALVVVTGACGFGYEFFNRADVVDVMVCGVFKGKCEGPLIPTVPAEAVDLVGWSVEC